VETGDRSIESQAPHYNNHTEEKECLPSSEEQLVVDTAIKIINDARCKNPYSAFGENIANKLATLTFSRGHK
jgi:hypothetical protein